MDTTHSPGGRGALRALSALLVCVASCVVAEGPPWWTNRTVLLSTAQTNDYAPLNVGQLKWMALAARHELDATVPHGAGPLLQSVLGAWLPDTSDYAAANVGQLKYVGSLYHDRLICAGYASDYPWGPVAATNDYALANIGQAKYVFSFDPARDTDGDGLADMWEVTHGLCPTNSDSDGDGLSDGYEARWGTVLAWGTPFYGIVNPPYLTNAVAVAGGTRHCAALLDDGHVVGWGDNSQHQCSIPYSVTNAIAIAARLYNTMALLRDGRVVCWGANDCGQTNVPTSVTGAVAIACGYSHGVVALRDGRVVCWGANSYGQCNVPSAASNVIAVGAGTYYSMALRADGRVVCWGQNNANQTNVPSTATGVVAVAAGGAHAVALRRDGRVVCWGQTLYGQTNVPPSVTNAVAIAAGLTHSIILRRGGGMSIWGSNQYGQTNVPPAGRYVRRLGDSGFFTACIMGIDPLDPDTDHDGVSDRDEIENATNPLASDSDQDGLSDHDELTVYHTDPVNPDTDGDGLWDGAEVWTYGTDPRRADSDWDGLTDYDEVIDHSTNPWDPDTDHDGLNDGDEVLTYHTDPLNPDTDGDTLCDGAEVFGYGTDPNSPDPDNDMLADADEISRGTNPWMADSDGEGLSDGDEVVCGTNPLVPDTDDDGLWDWGEINCGTDPLSADTDGDGLSDGDEVFQYSTNPLDPYGDVDGDGLTDSDEILRLGTCWWSSDTDGDGMPDGWEVEHGQDPLLNPGLAYDTDGDGVPDIFAYAASNNIPAPLTVHVDAASQAPYALQDGSLSAPFCTLTQALAAVESNGIAYSTIVVAPGYYAGAGNRGLVAHIPIMVWGSNATACLMDCGATSQFMSVEAECTAACLHGLTIVNAGGTNAGSALRLTGSALVSDCRIIGATLEAASSAAPALVACDGGASRLERCILTGWLGEGGTAIRCSDGAVTLDTCMIAGNVMPGGEAVVVSNSASVTICYSTIAANLGSHAVGIDGGGVSVSDSILWNNVSPQFRLGSGVSGGQVSVVNSYVQGGCPQGASVSTVETANDPGIVGLGWLRQGSPCINQGVGALPGGAVDVLGRPRVDQPDIGCFEYGSGDDDVNGDGLPDAWESCWSLPTSDVWADPDGDGLPNGIEFLTGNDPIGGVYVCTDSSGEQTIVWDQDTDHSVTGYQVALYSCDQQGGVWTVRGTATVDRAATLSSTFNLVAGYSGVRFRVIITSMINGVAASHRSVEWEGAAAGAQLRAWLLAPAAVVRALIRLPEGTTVSHFVERDIPANRRNTWDRFYVSSMPRGSAQNWMASAIAVRLNEEEAYNTWTNQTFDVSACIAPETGSATFRIDCKHECPPEADAPALYLIRWRPSVEVTVE